MKTGSESVEGIYAQEADPVRGIVTRMEDTKLPKCVMFGGLVRGAGCVGGRKKSGPGVSWTTSELSVSTPTGERLQPRTRENGARRRNKRRNVSRRN